MATTEVSLNGAPALRATVVIPRWGVWRADVECANIADLSGAAKLQVGDLEMTGTIVHGGPYATRGWYKVLGGAAGWGKVGKPASYRTQAGVKLSTVLGDAAREAGETLASFNDRAIGPAFMRAPGAELARILDLFAPEDWYVDESGVTHIGARTPVTFDGTYRLLDARPDLKRVLVNADSLKALLPGAKLEGLEAATVRHELTTDGNFRTHVFGAQGKTVGDRMVQAFVRIVRAVIRPFIYMGKFEYRVTGGGSGYLDLRPANPSLGLPVLGNVPMRFGIMGGRGDPAVNSSVLVGFVNFDPTRPYVDGFEGEWGSASIPTLTEIFGTLVRLGDGTAQKIAFADAVVTELGKIGTTLGSISGATFATPYTPPTNGSAIGTHNTEAS